MDKPLQSAPCSHIQGRDMSGEADSSEVVRRWKPRQLLGVEVLHYSGASEDRRSLSEDYALVLNLTGQYERRHRSTREQGGPGSLALCEPGEAYSIRRVQGPGSGHILLIDPAEMVRVAEGLGHRGGPPTFTASHVQAAELAEALQRLHRALSTPEASTLEVETHYARLMEQLGMRYLAGKPQRRPHLERRAVRRVRELLEERLEENVSLSDLAAHTSLSRFHLLRLFRDEVGMPPHTYQLQLRMARARRLLQRGVEPSEVAAQLGFTDQSHLTRHFKRLFRLTPGQYVRACRVQG